MSAQCMLDSDPRGPERDIIALAQDNGGPVFATLSCGHVAELVNHFAYRIGDRCHCLRCGPAFHWKGNQ